MKKIVLMITIATSIAFVSCQKTQNAEEQVQTETTVVTEQVQTEENMNNTVVAAENIETTETIEDSTVIAEKTPEISSETNDEIEGKEQEAVTN
ncbi:MAG: hypothetical protein JXR48_09620 [Candidatus Delongbacteria bacterium]|nr:hypothetical protein [Candidatus Delongbacteria bacterium]MBN2835211.1 hypothetical protein [Candidatus Delongbacteria bacterium]